MPDSSSGLHRLTPGPTSLRHRQKPVNRGLVLEGTSPTASIRPMRSTWRPSTASASPSAISMAILASALLVAGAAACKKQAPANEETPTDPQATSTAEVQPVATEPPSPHRVRWKFPRPQAPHHLRPRKPRVQPRSNPTRKSRPPEARRRHHHQRRPRSSNQFGNAARRTPTQPRP